jgi:putative MATE family efflux protein
MEMNMTRGNPWKLILQFMLPVFLGNVFYQCYNIIDTIIVGQFLGVKALAAVGATGSISFLIFGFVNGMTMGFTIPVAQKFGEGNEEQMKRYAGSALLLAAVIVAVMTVFSVWGMDWLLTMMKAPEDIFNLSKEYITIICGGMVFSVLYSLLSGLLRAIGNSKVPLYFLIISSVINVVLDIVFIADFNMGVGGAAYATVISQMVSGILCLIYIMKKVPALQLEKKHFRFDPMCCGKQIKLGIPMALQFSITAFGTMVTQTALNTFGSTIVASYVVAGKVEQIINQPYDALGATMATYSAQNWGVRDLKRLQKGCRIANSISVVYSVLIFLIVNPLVPYLVRLFVSGDAVAVTKYAQIYVFIGTSFFIPLGMIMIFRNMLQGCDFALLPMLGGAVELAGRVGAASFAVHFHSYVGVCFSNASAWFFAGIYLMIAYLVVMGRIKRRQAAVGTDAH